jgi:hypothetical protein
MGWTDLEEAVDSGAPGDKGAVREAMWAALMADCAHREAAAVSREQVLRELLDDAHARIRSLQAALQHASAAAAAWPRTDSGSPRRHIALKHPRVSFP